MLGLDHYEDLIKACFSNGVALVAALAHWDQLLRHPGRSPLLRNHLQHRSKCPVGMLAASSSVNRTLMNINVAGTVTINSWQKSCTPSILVCGNHPESVPSITGINPTIFHLPASLISIIRADSLTPRPTLLNSQPHLQMVVTLSEQSIQPTLP